MAARKQPGKRYFTVSEANATLPYLRAILRDVTELARELRERHERLVRLRPGERGGLSAAHQEEMLQARADLERGQERMQEYEAELKQIGVELKDYFTGLIDFPSVLDGREVYLCWRLDEPDVSHWHELEAGFLGRRKLMADAAR
ncbi:MAG TPA: DUF2203 domain-containing protein [Gemmataceae bacterium]|jgi:hypothetical protein|nr:DUF2203 domain-containing protein [Gemmataceae bacterium]